MRWHSELVSCDQATGPRKSIEEELPGCHKISEHKFEMVEFKLRTYFVLRTENKYKKFFFGCESHIDLKYCERCEVYTHVGARVYLFINFSL